MVRGWLKSSVACSGDQPARSSAGRLCPGNHGDGIRETGPTRYENVFCKKIEPPLFVFFDRSRGRVVAHLTDAVQALL